MDAREGGGDEDYGRKTRKRVGKPTSILLIPKTGDKREEERGN